MDREQENRSENDYADGSPLKRYLADIEKARATFLRRVGEVLVKIESMAQRRTKIEERLDDLIAEVNGLCRRRHNVISVSWALDRRRLETAITEPSGPRWHSVVIARGGRRHLNPIKRLSRARILRSYQGRQAEELLRLHREISILQKERDLITSRLARVQKALRYAEEIVEPVEETNDE